MATTAITCPQCHKGLRSTRPIPANKSIRCPMCGSHFHAPSPAAPDISYSGSTPREATMGTFVLAMGAALLLVGAGVAVAFLVMRNEPEPAPQPSEPVAKKEEERPKKPGKSDAELELEKQKKEFEKQKEEFELAKKKLDFDRFLADGNAALEKREFALAEDAFGKALALFPKDAKALQGLVAARSEKVIAEKIDEKDEKKREDFAKLMKQGNAALADKALAKAVQAFEGAIVLFPADPDAQKALGDARAALEKDETQKKNLTEFRKHMEKGRKALLAQRYSDAIGDFTSALILMPDDEEAKKGQQQAEQQLAAMKDLEKKKLARKDLLDDARAARDRKKYNEAIIAYKQILRLFPGDRQVELEKANVEKEQGRLKAEHGRLMAAAERAMLARRFEEAHQLFDQASTVLPEDPNATDGRRRAASAMRDFQAKQVAYFRYMQQGTFALNAQRFAEAAVAFREALRIVPLDRDAARGLQEAQAGLEKDLVRKREFDQHILAGQNALARRNFDEALRHFTSAQQIDPTDLRIRGLINQATYSLSVEQGRQAMQAGRFGEAVTHFQKALIAKPGDPLVQNMLREAMARNR